MALAMRKQIATLSSTPESSASSASSQKPLRDTPSLKSSTNHSFKRSMRDPSFSYSLAKISHDLTYGELKPIHFAKRSWRRLQRALLPSEKYIEKNLNG